MEDVTFLWGGWETLARIVVVTTLGYAWLVVLVRRTGPRTLAKMTPFDFLLTVTLGSAFGRVVTAQGVAIAEVVVAFAMLVGLQWTAATARARSTRVAGWIDAEPALLYHGGRLLHDAMRRHRITADDLAGVVRENGMGSLAEAEAIVLEPGGTFAVISPDQLGDGSAVPVAPASTT